MLRFKQKTSQDDLSDEALLSLYLGDGSARHLGMLYERYMPMVYGVCLKILKDPAKSEDAVMGIYEELVQKLKQHKVESFRGWLYVLARNYCLMEYRKMQRQPVYSQAPENMVWYDAVEQAVEYEFPKQEASLQKCLDELIEIQRLCVCAFYYENQSYKEIAENTREEIGKVRSFIQNGKRNLRICMEKGNDNLA